MPTPELSLYASASVGNSQAIGVNAAVISNPGKGRWLVSGVVRHEVVDGCRLCIGDSAGSPTPLFTIPNGVNASQDFGPLYVDILNNTDDIFIELAAATTGAGTASALLFAQRTSAI